MEIRVLLSAYNLSDLGLFGVNATGANPRSTLVADAGGNLYGTTRQGGTWGAGTVFEIPSGSNTITVLASFNGTSGAQPYGGVTLDSSGNLFGTTYWGGAYDHGTVFEIAKGSHAITTIVTFNWNNGGWPAAGLTMDGSGNLYGTTSEGGLGSIGVVFEIAHGSNTLTQLASASYSSGGYIDSGVALDSSGNLYGTEYVGGAYQEGCVFEVAKGSGTLTTIASFTQATGDNPQAGVVVDALGNIYGTTAQFGPGGYGTVFEIAKGSTAITNLATFNDNNGDRPLGDPILDASGNLYGTTSSGGPGGYGTIFEIPAGSSTLTTLASFNSSNGSELEAGLMFDAGGNIYGTTLQGGPGGSGAVYELPKGSNTPVVLASFAGTNATSPRGGLVADSSGNLYGTAQNGGATGNGAVYEIAKGSNTVSTLASFNGTNGSDPSYTLTWDASGNLYGTTLGGGNRYGTVFEIARGTNAITTLASFNYYGNGAWPDSGLTADASGNLYGTTEGGATYGSGTVFEIASGSHTLVTLASFPANAQSGGNNLAVDGAGNLYGTINTGGSFGDGTVFELAKGSGQITTLASFNGTNGQAPGSGVVRDGAGNLYGTTIQGGPNNDGVLFELPSGSTTLTMLAAFDTNTIGYDASRLSLDPAGNLYGATDSGGYARGHVFELAKGTGTLTSLAAFNNDIGAYPEWGVTLDAVGNLYGTMSMGGPGDVGSAFELAANTAVALTPAGGSNPSPTNQGLSFTAVVSGGVPNGESVTLVDASNNNATVATGALNGGSATLTVPAGTLSAGTHNLVAVYGGDANFAASESAAYTQAVQAAPPPPSLTGVPVINGDNPNGLYTAAGQTTPGQQRSMVEDIVYTFNEPVTIPNANLAFTLAIAGPAGGTLPTSLYAQAVAGSNGTQWAVSLTGQPEGTIASIANGEYSITINPAYVFAAADGTTSMSAGTGPTDQFYRLYGDVFGTQNVTALDYNRFKSSLTTYNPMFDNYNTGNITALDYNLFKKDLSVNYSGDGFVTTI